MQEVLRQNAREDEGYTLEPGVLFETHTKPYKLKVIVRGRPIHWTLNSRTALREIKKILKAHNVHKLYRPEVSHSSIRVLQKDFKPDPVLSSENIEVCSGGEGDAIDITSKQAAAIFMADCIVVVLFDPISGKAVMFHFSRESGVRGGITEAALSYFSEEERRRLIVYLSPSIATEHFDHHLGDPKRGKDNKEMIEAAIKRHGIRGVIGNYRRGEINLREALRIQLRQAGVAKHIFTDQTDTFSEKDNRGYFQFWSARRDKDNKFKKCRNMVLAMSLPAR